MKWKKLEKPYRRELIKEVNLESDGKIIVSAGKDNPVPGTVTHHWYKKIAGRDVLMCRFSPDVAPDLCWEFGSKSLRSIRTGGTNE